MSVIILLGNKSGDNIMATIPIRTLPDQILRQKAKRVKTADSSIHKLISDMIETMHMAPGVGLAAPQIGIPLRVIVLDIPEEEEIALINPEIIRQTGEQAVTEGCLSIPGYYGHITRAESVTVKGRNPAGKEIRIKASGLLSQALQHEIDHINGILYIDHLESMDELHKVEAAENQL